MLDTTDGQRGERGENVPKFCHRKGEMKRAKALTDLQEGNGR